MDGDGVPDILTGSYLPGDFFFFKGQGAGKFAKAVKLLNKEGKPLVHQPASAPATIDWNGDGKLDLVVGFINGPMMLFLNQGDLKFGAPTPVLAAGKQIAGSDLGPRVADWDRDGTLDLVVGDGEGQVKFYRGHKGQGNYSFDAGQVLIKASSQDASARSGWRTKVDVVDWNGDGKDDLLVGDFFSRNEPPKDQSAKAKARRKQYETESNAIMQEQSKLYEALMKKHGLKPADFQDEAKARKFSEAVQKDQRIAALGKKYSQTLAKYRDVIPKQEMGGNVWLYLRK